MKELEMLLLNTRTLQAAKGYAANPSHAVLISGPRGTGKSSIAFALASMILGVGNKKLENNPDFVLIKKSADKQEISIEQIRSLLKRLVTKAGRGPRDIRVILVEDAELLTHEAQNSLLKILEEPPVNNYFILTTANHKLLLPTVLSRLRIITIDPVSLEQVKSWYGDRYSNEEVEKMWHLSSGFAGLADQLLKNENHELVNWINRAKEFIGLSVYERLLLSDEFTKNRDNIANLLAAIDKIYSLAMQAKVNQSKGTLSRLLRSRKLILKAQNMLSANTNLRLAYLELCLNL